jgi:hypothetical protein
MFLRKGNVPMKIKLLALALTFIAAFAATPVLASYGGGGSTSGWHASGNSGSAPGHNKL